MGVLHALQLHVSVHLFTAAASLFYDMNIYNLNVYQ